MADETLEIQIERKLQEITAQKQTLDELAAKCVAAAKATLPQFFENRKKTIVVAEPETVQKLGIEGARAAKEELKQFIQRLPELISAAMPKADEWWHHQPLPTDPNDEYNAVTRKNGREMDTRIMRGTNQFGEILTRHGLTESAKTADTPVWPKEIGLADGLYVDGFRRLVTLSNDLASLEKRKIERDAKDLWDRA